MTTTYRHGTPDARFDVRHGTKDIIEVVRDLDRFTARRLVEHELSAGRIAAMYPAEERRTGSYR
jgi:hypothetical protein